MEIKFKNPEMDKGYGVEIYNPLPDTRGEVLLLFSEIKKARPFLQCDSREYLFIEFWTDEKEEIQKAFETIKNKLLT